MCSFQWAQPDRISRTVNGSIHTSTSAAIVEPGGGQRVGEMQISLRDMCIGFVAGALAVVIFHQGMLYAIGQLGWTKGTPWGFGGVPPYGVPRVINAMFWGGLWGALFGAFADRMPGGPYWSRGFIFGLVFTTILGSWLTVSLIKGRPPFSGFLSDYDISKLRNGFLLNSVAFGIGLGVLFQLLRVRRLAD